MEIPTHPRVEGPALGMRKLGRQKSCQDACKAHQKVLSTLTTLEEEIERLSQMRARSWSRVRSRSWDCIRGLGKEGGREDALPG